MHARREKKKKKKEEKVGVGWLVEDAMTRTDPPHTVTHLVVVF